MAALLFQLRGSRGAALLAARDAGITLPTVALPSCSRGFLSKGGDDFFAAPPPPSSGGGDFYDSRQSLPHFGFAVVPEKKAYVIERFGRYSRVLNSGLHFLIPFIDSISYIHSLKEETIPIQRQTAITRDNVSITIDGVLYIRVDDPVKASYGVDMPLFAVSQLAQTTMRSELGKINLDKTFAERDELNQNIVRVINHAALEWGLKCLRYEIRDILVPTGVRAAMELQAEAERRKRAVILESEGERLARINRADAEKRELVLVSEAKKTEVVNIALGEATAIEAKAKATSRALGVVSETLAATKGADKAAQLKIAERYMDAFGEIAKEGNTIMLPWNGGPEGMIASAMKVWDKLKSRDHRGWTPQTYTSTSRRPSRSRRSSTTPKIDVTSGMVDIPLDKAKETTITSSESEFPAEVPDPEKTV